MLQEESVLGNVTPETAILQERPQPWKHHAQVSFEVEDFSASEMFCG